jgi:hypothetical protein
MLPFHLLLRFIITFILFNLNFEYVNSSIPDQKDITAWLSGAAYCSKENYYNMTVGGPAKGFIYYYSLYDIKSDLQGFIGVLPKTKTIYIVYRGSSSPLNWIYDIELMQVKYDSYPECEDCMVHKGFYHSALNILDQTLFHMKQIKVQYPRYKIIVSGHSYGAAVCQLIAMELLKAGFNLSIYNFGQPRVGNSVYATLVNQMIEENWRFVHDKDIVPHLPPGVFVDYFHSCREIFEDDTSVLNVCNNTKCEDPNCSCKYKITELNTEDHLVYLGHRLSCEASTI